MEGAVMRNMACRAVAQASLSATTASLDDEQAWPLLLVAGWPHPAADIIKGDAARETVPTCGPASHLSRTAPHFQGGVLPSRRGGSAGHAGRGAAGRLHLAR